MTTRSTYTTVSVRAEDVVEGEIVALGGLVFTRLRAGGPLCKVTKAQRTRFREVLSVVKDCGWVELEFVGGDCPDNERTHYVLMQPFELVRVQVERA